MTTRMLALPADVFQAVLDNLTAQPYRDVAGIIAAVQEHARTVDVAEPAPEAEAPTE